VVGHGNEVRLPSTHLHSTPYSHFGAGAADWAPVDQIEKNVAENLTLIADLDVPVLVSTAGLLADLPQAHLLGVVIEPERWANEEPTLVRKRLRVVHAPTQTHVKGTHLIEPVVHRLHEEGVIDYVELKGIAHEEMPKVFGEADIILDQFRVGDYGVGACEAMASGRIVLTHVTEQVRTEAEERAGMPLPIPSVTIDTLEEVLRDISARRDHYRTIAAAGPEYVRRLHDGSFSRDVLLREFLER
jgi:hypothetical protein